MKTNLFGAPTSPKGEILGCSACPLDKSGSRKIKGLVRIHDQKAFLWAMTPGYDEDQKGLELVGKSGELLWKTLEPVGLRRPDFAVQNVCRCRPTDENGENRDPSKRELLCCSCYNDEAMELNGGHAKVHLILGEVAATQLLGKAYRKDKPVQWWKERNAYVVLNFHPSYVLRKGGEQAGADYYTFRDRFRAVRAVLDHPGRFGYVKSLGYKTVRTLGEFDAMEKALRAESKVKRRVSFDIEDGTVDGKRVMLLAGFGTGHYPTASTKYDPIDWKRWKGQCWSVVLDHPEARYETSHAREMKARVKKLVEDEGLEKSLHNGSYDTKQCKEFLNAKLRGYTYDSMYSTWLRYSFLRSVSLENLTYRFFPEFADYKDTVAEWENYADAPLENLVLRNCGDCDVTKRLEERFAPQVSHALGQVYIACGMFLDKMEGRGPRLDMENWKKAKAIVPAMCLKLDRQLQQAVGREDFNARATDQVAWLVYEFLGLVNPEGTRSTQKEILEYLLAETGNSILDVVMTRRRLGVLDSTFLNAFARSAEMHGGELRTHWYLCGAATGRLRSGGHGDDGILNFQNVSNDILFGNMIVSDKNWRKALEE